MRQSEQLVELELTTRRAKNDKAESGRVNAPSSNRAVSPVWQCFSTLLDVALSNANVYSGIAISRAFMGLFSARRSKINNSNKISEQFNAAVK